MKIEVLNERMLQEFFEYCRMHRNDVDDSFLYDQDLEEFKIGEENPTYLVLDELNHIVAAASLIINEHYRKGREGRFRIFHSDIEDVEIYKQLLDKMIPHAAGLDSIYVFADIENTFLMSTFASLGMTIGRYSCLLVRNDKSTPEYNIPEGYQLRPFVKGQDEKSWCEVRNPAFATLKGSETPISPEDVGHIAAGVDAMDGAMIMLFHGERPVGVVRGSHDELDGDEILDIGPVAVIPEYQGKGLGRILLRAELEYASKHGYDRTVLCVNADNQRAKQLYLNEGFVQVEAVACFHYFLNAKK